MASMAATEHRVSEKRKTSTGVIPSPRLKKRRQKNAAASEDVVRMAQLWLGFLEDQNEYDRIHSLVTALDAEDFGAQIVQMPEEATHVLLSEDLEKTMQDQNRMDDMKRFILRNVRMCTVHWFNKAAESGEFFNQDLVLAHTPDFLKELQKMQAQGQLAEPARTQPSKAITVTPSNFASIVASPARSSNGLRRIVCKSPTSLSPMQVALGTSGQLPGQARTQPGASPARSSSGLRRIVCKSPTCLSPVQVAQGTSDQLTEQARTQPGKTITVTPSNSASNVESPARTSSGARRIVGTSPTCLSPMQVALGASEPNGTSLQCDNVRCSEVSADAVRCTTLSEHDDSRFQEDVLVPQRGAFECNAISEFALVRITSVALPEFLGREGVVDSWCSKLSMWIVISETGQSIWVPSHGLELVAGPLAASPVCTHGLSGLIISESVTRSCDECDWQLQTNDGAYWCRFCDYFQCKECHKTKVRISLRKTRAPAPLIPTDGLPEMLAGLETVPESGHAAVVSVTDTTQELNAHPMTMLPTYTSATQCIEFPLEPAIPQSSIEPSVPSTPSVADRVVNMCDSLQDIAAKDPPDTPAGSSTMSESDHAVTALVTDTSHEISEQAISSSSMLPSPSSATQRTETLQEPGVQPSAIAPAVASTLIATDRVISLRDSLQETANFLRKEQPEEFKTSLSATLLDCAVQLYTVPRAVECADTLETEVPEEVLGIRKGASASEIRAAYREQALLAHPDKGGDAQAFCRLRRAYLALSASSEVDSVVAEGQLQLSNSCIQMKDHKALVRARFEADGCDLKGAVKNLRGSLNELNLMANCCGENNTNEEGEEMCNQCFYLSMAGSYLGRGKKSSGLHDTALSLKRVIEAAVLTAHPDWAGHAVGEDVQAFSDFLFFVLGTNALLSETAVAIFDSVSGFVEIFKGRAFPGDDREMEQRANTLTMQYVPGHYKALLPKAKSKRPTLAQIVKSLDAHNVRYVVTEV